MDRITQLYSAFGSHFKIPFMEKYGMVNYKNPKKPVIFFGCYGSQISKAFSNESVVKIIWAGSDCPPHMANAETVARLKERGNIHHIAISKFIANDLERVGLPFTRVPIVPHGNEDISAEPLGDAIYMYKPSPYGRNIYQAIKSEFHDMEFIETWHARYPRPELIELYKKCFLGLRFTNHDGLSNTAVELGLMGRKIIWNGDTPNAIPYKGIPDILESIHKAVEEKMSGSHDYKQTAVSVKEYLNVGEDWLYV